MPYEIIIGRRAQQQFVIPDSCDAVSRQHARFWVDDNGNWFIDDLTGGRGNGTFVRDSTGAFRRIQTKMIDRDTVIRLGCGGHHSFTFYANRIIAPTNYSYEFDLLQRQMRELRQEQATIETANEKKAKRLKLIRGGSALVTLGIMAYSALTKSYLGLAPAAITGAVTALLPTPDQKQMKELLERKKNLLLCPCCFNPISEAALYNRVCPMCKAKG